VADYSLPDLQTGLCFTENDKQAPYKKTITRSTVSHIFVYKELYVLVNCFVVTLAVLLTTWHRRYRGQSTVTLPGL